MAESYENDEELLRFGKMFSGWSEVKVGRLNEEIRRYKKLAGWVRDDVREELLHLKIDLLIGSIKELRQHQNRLRELETQLKTAKGSINLDREKIKQTFEQLRAIAVANDSELKITEDEIRLGIGQIDVEHNGVIYDIGRFEVAIYPGATEAKDMVRCFNLTRIIQPEGPYVDFYHPHVWGPKNSRYKDGECCLGNILRYVETLVNDKQFVPLVYLMVVFLKTVNPQDSNSWELTRDSWPVKPRTDEGLSQGEEVSSDGREP